MVVVLFAISHRVYNVGDQGNVSEQDYQHLRRKEMQEEAFELEEDKFEESFLINAIFFPFKHELPCLNKS